MVLRENIFSTGAIVKFIKLLTPFLLIFLLVSYLITGSTMFSGCGDDDSDNGPGQPGSGLCVDVSGQWSLAMEAEG